MTFCQCTSPKTPLTCRDSVSPEADQNRSQAGIFRYCNFSEMFCKQSRKHLGPHEFESHGVIMDLPCQPNWVCPGRLGNWSCTFRFLGHPGALTGRLTILFESIIFAMVETMVPKHCTICFSFYSSMLYLS